MSDDKKAKKDELHADGKAVEGVEGAEGVLEEGAPKKFGVKKIVLFIVLPLLLIGGGGAGAYFMGYLDKILGKTDVNCETVVEGDEGYEGCKAKLAESGEMKPGTFIDIPDMIVNLSSTSKQPRFLKIKLKVELDDPKDQAKFETVLPRVIDQFQTYLRELRIEDLKGSSGMYRMKIELLSRVKAAVPDMKVRDVLFQEILVQ